MPGVAAILIAVEEVVVAVAVAGAAGIGNEYVTLRYGLLVPLSTEYVLTDVPAEPALIVKYV